MTALEIPSPALLYPTLDGLTARTRAELIELIEAMAEDWRKLNEIHNATAEQRDWCSEYEDRQAMHNQNFTVLKLLGRKRIVGTRAAGL